MRLQTNKQRIQELQEENRRLVRTQELIVDNILSVQESDSTYTGNRYKTYEAAVGAVALKYAGQADWGVLQVGNIVDLRAAYIVGQGIKVSKVEENEEDADAADAAYAFAERFIKKNELDHELPQDLAREGEIEGKTLIKLFSKETEDERAIEGVDILLRWVSWTTNKYKVKVGKEDYLQFEGVEWTTADGPVVKLTPEECVYKRFAGRLDIPNETMPRTGKCLTQIENLDMALRDWRQINALYAAPTPHIQCDNATQAKEINEAIEKVNWKIGKFFAHTGEFGYAQPSSEGQKAIESEIITLMKLISGTTGVPIGALGAPELTTKLGADSQGQLDIIAMSTSKEREIWKAAFYEVISKAMRMWNEKTKKTPLRPELIKVDLPVVTEAQWNRIVSTWLPIKNAQEITSKTFLSQIPGLDVEAELAALEEEEAGAVDKFSKQQDPEVDPDADPNAEPPAAPPEAPADFMAPGTAKGLTGQVIKYKTNPGNIMKKGV